MGPGRESGSLRETDEAAPHAVACTVSSYRDRIETRAPTAVLTVDYNTQSENFNQ